MAARIYIVGGPGSGKTTLAESVGQRLAIAVLHLDEHLDWPGLPGGVRLERDAAGHPWESVLVARRGSCRGSGFSLASWPPRLFHSFAVPLPAGPLHSRSRESHSPRHPRLSSRSCRSCSLLIADLAGTNAFPGCRRLYRFIRSVRQRHRHEPEDVGDQWTRAAVVTAVGRHHGNVIRLTGGSPTSYLEVLLARLSAQLQRG